MQQRMRPTVTAKIERGSSPRPLPADLADVALLDINDVCTALRMSASWVHDEVRGKRFPQPLRYGPRCTRWTAASIRQYLIERAAQPQAEAAEFVKARAKKASDAARAKRTGPKVRA